MPVEFVGGLGLLLGVLLAFALGFMVMLARFYRKVEQGHALLINRLNNRIDVTFTGGFILPIIHRGEVMDISVKTIQVERRGSDGLICADNIRADIQVTFYVQVNRKEDDVLTVAQRVGCQRASDPHTLQEIYAPKFSEALKTVGKRMEFEQLYTHRTQFKDAIIEVIGRDLDGYVLADCAIDYLEQTPITSLDPKNVLDAFGIRKITEITAGQNVHTNDLRQEERKAIAKQNLEADEAVLELEKRKAEAVARQQREIANIQARETAETALVDAEQHRIAELARLKASEDLEVAALAKQRQVEVADKDRERVLAIKTEQVFKDRDLEKISREREVELQRIDKEKALEVQRKEIAEVVRTRIVVDKTVAEEEERIKTLRVTQEAERGKVTLVTAAEAEAQQAAVRTVKEAEAAERSAEHRARERLVLANASLEAADKESKARVRMSEGVQAEVAAEGLALARVAEAEAVALQKRGVAEAAVTLEKARAEAQGSSATGDVRIRLRGEEIVLAEKQGKVEADVLRQRAVAEAAGIGEKADAMKRLEGAAREHEEFRLRLDQEKVVSLARIDAGKTLATAQAQVLGQALGNADIRLVGGDGGLFESIASSIALGQGIDTAVQNSDTLRTLLAPYLSGERQLPDDIAAVVGQLASGGARDLAATAALARLATQGKG